MTTHNSRKTKKLFAVLLMSLALQACGSGADSVQEDIFTDASIDNTQAQPMAIEESRQQRFVRVNFNALKKALAGGAGTLKLNLFKEKNLTVIVDEVQKISDSNFVAVGHIQNDINSSVTLVLNGDVVVANVRRAQSNGAEKQESYEVRYLQNGVHVVSEPVAKDEQDADELCPAVKAPYVAGDKPMISVPKAMPGQDTVMATPVVSMLVAYTPGARYRQGGTTAMQSLIQMGIADTNTALANSGANLRVRLSGTMEVASNETGSWSSDLSYLRSKTDSRWNEVHARRTSLGADQVTMIASYASTCCTAGIGYIGASYSSAFTVVKASAFNQYTFTHELGHNIGLNHSDGYVNSSGGFRTIMAYGSYPRIRRFSNPNLTYNGYRTGSSYYDHDSVKIINSNAYRMGDLTGSAYSVEAAADEQDQH
jgi:peptidyl-Asp metalloendopeptidase